VRFVAAADAGTVADPDDWRRTIKPSPSSSRSLGRAVGRAVAVRQALVVVTVAARAGHMAPRHLAGVTGLAVLTSFNPKERPQVYVY